MLFTPFAVVALLASFVNGQALPDACIQNCTQTAASVTGCVSFTNVSCVCSSTAFQQAALSCLVSDCTQADVQTAETLQQTICGGSLSCYISSRSFTH
ncbi:hypothetical protein SISNIDRAFT_413911 [Sistotremastrum niveocremeum HHB9708]|uniref:CFEM domain-containing protein n=1 Tax=Sistotremastrum niveocremeum HHB9708 TaxID=1314777 RepID=A0A164SJD6_9AGAM|nr:hypothetical protein SISNIDRAFT_413911 [Sistotremastrum niveocremeum HHB9708]